MADGQHWLGMTMATISSGCAWSSCLSVGPVVVNRPGPLIATEKALPGPGCPLVALHDGNPFVRSLVVH